MKTVAYETVVNAVAELCQQAAINLPADVSASLKMAAKNEKSSRATSILHKLLENATIAGTEKMPICQDCGTALFFVEMGLGVSIRDGELNEAINEGVRKGYKQGYLRASIVADPLYNRTNTGDNTPAVIHCARAAGESLGITLLPKGGGCENMSRLAMLTPSQGEKGIIDFVVDTIVRAGGRPCPPLIVGVGIGGTADTVMQMAKTGLLRPLGQKNPQKEYALLEETLLCRINATNIGPQGLGGDTTALGVHITAAPCHIASLPVAVNVNCHAARRATMVL
jgi:fumarate hydratase subunit alpha